jgi:hypothetical protein
VISWFQAFAFKFNLYRYIEAREAAEKAAGDRIAAAKAEVGLYGC